MTTTQPILHQAEELGQSRAYTTAEVKALAMVVLLCAGWGAITTVLVAVGYWLYQKMGWGILFPMALPVGFVIAGGIVLIKGVHEQLDGLRSWRKATSYVPIIPQPQGEAAHPPILVKPYGGSPYTLGPNGATALLPDGRKGLELSPPTVSTILREIVTHHDGLWSRDRLMSIRVNGERVTRSLYEELTSALTRAGLLQQRPQGGYCLPQDIQTFDDLRRYLPGIDSRTAGGTAGGQEWGGESGIPPSDRGMSLAERRAQMWKECDCDVVSYLERRLNHD
jgi:hypothetical protein